MFNDYEYEESYNGHFFQGQIYDDQYYGSTVISEFDLGTEYLVSFSSRSLKTRGKYISFAQLVLLSLHIF